jgi:hypothetical protein
VKLLLVALLMFAARPDGENVLRFHRAACAGEYCENTVATANGITFFLPGSLYQLTFRDAVLKDQKRKVQLRLPKINYIETVTYLQNGSRLYLAYTDNYGGEITGYLAAVDLRTFRLSWMKKALRGDLDPLLTKKGILFVGYGSIGLVDPETGQFKWNHTDLYERTGYDSFDNIRFVGNEVEICSGKCLDRGRDLSMVVVNQITGEIVQPKLKKYVLPR